MFEGEQFHQLIASTARTPASSATLPLPFVSPPNFLPSHHHHVPPAASFPSFDPIQPHFLYPAALSHHNQFHHPRKVDEPKQPQHHHDSTVDNHSLVAVSMEIGTVAASPERMDTSPWPTEEVLALFRIRSSLENWFPEFTWDHVSRKLAELGYRRNAAKCKEKFEQESRCFNNSNGCSNINNNYRIFSELEELCQGDDPDNHHNDENNPQKLIPPAGHNKPTDKPIIAGRDGIMGQDFEKDDSENNTGTSADALISNVDDDDDDKLEDRNKIESIKRKRMEEGGEHHGQNKKIRNKKMKKKKKKLEKFEMLKGFCEQMVNKLMAQQEEMHNRLIQDMVKRDGEKVKKEEAWKKLEFDRLNKELEARAKEQEIAGERQAAFLKFLSKLASNDPTANPPANSSSSSSSLAVAQNPNIITPITTHAQGKKVDHHDDHQKDPTSATPNPTSSTPNLFSPQNPNTPHNLQSNTLSLSTPQKPHKNPNTVAMTVDQKEDMGKRWPRDEVLALINIRCSLSNNSGDQENSTNKDGAGAVKAPLWERISQGMLELGYRRSAKRCKEKWENINKYFRKTKDANKKRSLDSRTCPYFHQLSTLYNQGKLSVPENHSDQPESSALDVHDSEGEKNMAPAVSVGFDFDL